MRFKSCVFVFLLEIKNLTDRNNFITGLVTPPLVRQTGFGAYGFFAVFCVLSFLFVWFFVPEAKGKTLGGMDGGFKHRNGTDGTAKRACYTRVLGETTNGTIIQA